MTIMLDLYDELAKEEDNFNFQNPLTRRDVMLFGIVKYMREISINLEKIGEKLCGSV